jgi:general secretion pathway protein L
MEEIVKDWLDWWMDVARQMLPWRTRRLIDRCVICLTTDGIQIVRSGATETYERDGFEARLRALGADLKRRREPAVLRIAKDSAVVRRLGAVALPASEHRSAALLDIEASTPFRLDGVHVLMLRPDLERGGRTCAYAIVKRSLLDPLTGVLKIAGINVEGVEIDDGVSLRQAHAADKAALFQTSHVAGKRIAVLVTTALLAAAAGTYAHEWFRQDAALYSLEAESIPLAAEAKAVRSALDARAARVAEVLALRKSVEGRMLVSSVWEELSRVLPDSTYLTEMTVKTDGVSIIGFSAAASAIIVALEGSGLFDQAAFAGPVVKAPGFSGDRFAIELKTGGKG